MAHLLNTIVSNTFTRISVCMGALTAPRNFVFVTDSSINDIDTNNKSDIEPMIIDYDTALFINDVTPKNEELLDYKLDSILEKIVVCPYIDGDIILLNSNGIAIKSLTSGDNSISDIKLGLYYIAIVKNSNALVVKPFYCLK